MPTVILDEKVSGTANELLSILEEEKEALSELIQATAAEQKALTSGQIEELEVILKGKESVIQRINQMEVNRSQIVAVLAGYLDLEGEPSLKSLSARLSGPESDRLEELGLEVAEMSGQADRLNRINAYLIGSSLNYLDTFINRLAGWQDPSHLYMRGGSFKVKKKNNLFINEEA
jgi:flagellar biosynthesis/type III secretory pathway chaperone